LPSGFITISGLSGGGEGFIGGLEKTNNNKKKIKNPDFLYYC
jgi:hypothetical protein